MSYFLTQVNGKIRPDLVSSLIVLYREWLNCEYSDYLSRKMSNYDTKVFIMVPYLLLALSLLMRDGYLHLFIQIDGADYIRLITSPDVFRTVS